MLVFNLSTNPHCQLIAAQSNAIGAHIWNINAYIDAGRAVFSTYKTPELNWFALINAPSVDFTTVFTIL